MRVCDCYRRLEPFQSMVGECLGAKNKPRVDCDGDESRCLFYSDRRKKAKVVTNAERIRSMTDEELAKFITDIDLCELLCGSSPVCDGCWCCEPKMLSWLKAPVEVQDGA